MKVFFLKVHTNDEKMKRLCQAIEWHFQKGDFIYVMTPNEQAANYMDELLWKHLPMSFIPHVIADALSNERVVIGNSKTNLNNGNVIFNLSGELPEFETPPSILYELMDLTSQQKERMSMEKYRQYQVKGAALKLG